MKTGWVDERVDYTGRELRSHWIMERFGLEGDAVVGFIGSCKVIGEDLVDREDFLLGHTVEADEMLHLIAEIFGTGLPGIVFGQRLLCGLAKDLIDRAAGRSVITRDGDDLYVGDGKLSVSVATASPVSGLIHLGLNITTQGVPVKAACLCDIGIDPRELACMILAAYASEIDDCLAASRKVKPVL